MKKTQIVLTIFFIVYIPLIALFLRKPGLDTSELRSDMVNLQEQIEQIEEPQSFFALKVLKLLNSDQVSEAKSISLEQAKHYFEKIALRPEQTLTENQTKFIKKYNSVITSTNNEDK
jgi:hypothetical protein